MRNELEIVAECVRMARSRLIEIARPASGAEHLSSTRSDRRISAVCWSTTRLPSEKQANSLDFNQEFTDRLAAAWLPSRKHVDGNRLKPRSMKRHWHGKCQRVRHCRIP
jgi:hypothetical protein